MKKLVALSILSLSFIPVSAMAQTFKGYVADTMCSSSKGAAAVSSPAHAACAKKCIGMGSPAVLVVGGTTIYKVSNPDKLTAFAGQEVTVNGKLDNGVLTVASVK
jgi:hypothetical protein